MSLALDADYGWLALALRPECERRGIDFDVTDLNSQGWGDVLYLSDHGTYSGEIKGNAEILGGLEHCEAQLQKQLANADRCALLVYGKVEPAEDGNSYAMDSREDRVHYTHDRDSGISRTYKRRYFRQNYLGYRTWLARLMSLGVDVYEVPSREALVTQLVAVHTVLTTEGSTLNRIIVEKPIVTETDIARARFMRQLMGLDANIGEELASAIATWLGNRHVLGKWNPTLGLTIIRLIDALSMNEGNALAAQPLRNGKRTVGPAAVKRLREALGLGGEA